MKEIKYCVPSLTYFSLRKMLKSGIGKPGVKTIKHFQCNCDKHHGLLVVKAMVHVSDQKLAFEKCSWTTDEKGDSAIDGSGQLTIQAYRFYFDHPDWKVRVAVAHGLAKLNTADSQQLLLHLAKDKHYGVSLAAVQFLNTQGKKSLEMLKKTAKGSRTKHILEAVEKSEGKIEHFLTNKRLLKDTVREIRRRNLSGQRFKNLLSVGKLYTDKNIFNTRLTAEGKLQKKFLASQDFTINTDKQRSRW